MKYYLMYMRVSENKQKEPVFEGPWVGAMSEDEEYVEGIKTKLNEESSGSIILTKTYTIEEEKIGQIHEEGVEYFEALKNEMSESFGILSRPKKRKKK